jgi:hypothetical protein
MEEQKEIKYGKLILVPAVITLAITLSRLCAELMSLPGWLANKHAGGADAILGIVWLPPIFGVYFALKLAGAPGKRALHLFKTLLLYGLAARIPVIIVMGLAIHGNWGTHYDAFVGGLATASSAAKFWEGGVLIQILWWALIWTVGTGMATGGIIFLFKREVKSDK